MTRCMSLGEVKFYGKNRTKRSVRHETYETDEDKYASDDAPNFRYVPGEHPRTKLNNRGTAGTDYKFIKRYILAMRVSGRERGRGPRCPLDSPLRPLSP